MSGDGSDQDDTPDEESFEQRRQIRDRALNENIQKRIKKIRECQIRYEETHDPEEARRALTLLGELNERLTAWASESLIHEIIKEYQVDPDLAQSIISLQIDNLQETAKWPADALRGLLATLAKTTNMGLPTPLAHSICSDLELANRGVKPKWFLVRGEKQSNVAKDTAIVHLDRERKKWYQIWFVGWVYYSGFHGDGTRSAYNDEWKNLSEKLGAEIDTIKMWAQKSQKTGLDKYFWKGAVNEVKARAKDCKARNLDYFPYPDDDFLDDAERWFQFSDEIFEKRVAEYLSFNQTQPD